MCIKKGSLVKAKAGRDNNSYFVALEFHDGRVLITDGKKRKLSNPKKKNPRHISPVGAVIDTNGLTDKKLRKLILAFETQDAPQQTTG